MKRTKRSWKIISTSVLFGLMTLALAAFAYADYWTPSENGIYYNNGSVGISTFGSAQAKLDVRNDNNSTVADWPGHPYNTEGYDGLRILNHAGSGEVSSINFRNYKSNDSILYTSGRIGLMRRGAGLSDFAFALREGGSGMQEIMRIRSDGTVGIGMTSPTTTLDVEGLIRTRETSKGSCNTDFAGAIAYEVTNNTGKFYGCRQTGNSTYAWTELH